MIQAKTISAKVTDSTSGDVTLPHDCLWSHPRVNPCFSRPISAYLGPRTQGRRCSANDVDRTLSFERKGGPTFLGKKVKLDTPTLGLAANRKRQVLVPAESVIEIVSVPTDYQRMVDVLWDGEPLTMFVHDVDVPEN